MRAGDTLKIGPYLYQILEVKENRVLISFRDINGNLLSRWFVVDNVGFRKVS